jgi:hypothetical protein
MLLGHRSPGAKKANRRMRSGPPRLFTSAETNGSAFDTGTQAHESYSLGVGLQV